MIITLSPTMLLDFESKITISQSTQPIYKKEAKELYDLLKGVSVEEIACLMDINPQLALDTYGYINSFDLPQTAERQAALAYDGIAYQGLDIETFSDKDLEFAQKYVVLFSGLYGMLRPLDMIKPHRLEMQTKLMNSRGKNLYDYWKETLTKQMSDAMENSSKIWVNLTSKEYTKVIDRKKLPSGHQMIMPVFKEARDNGYKQVIVYSKKARGMMARFIIQNQIEDSEYIKGFDTEGYSYSEQLSGGEEWVFIR